MTHMFFPEYTLHGFVKKRMYIFVEETCEFESPDISKVWFPVFYIPKKKKFQIENDFVIFKFEHRIY